METITLKEEDLVSLEGRQFFVDGQAQLWGRCEQGHKEQGIANAISNILNVCEFTPSKEIQFIQTVELAENEMELYNYELRSDLLTQRRDGTIASFRKDGRDTVVISLGTDEVNATLRMTYEKFYQWLRCTGVINKQVGPYPEFNLRFPCFSFLEKDEENALWQVLASPKESLKNNPSGKGHIIPLTWPLMQIPFKEEGEATARFQLETLNRWVYEFFACYGRPKHAFVIIAVIQEESSSEGEPYAFFYDNLLPSGENGNPGFLPLGDLVENETFWAASFQLKGVPGRVNPTEEAGGLSFEAYSKRGFNIGEADRA